MTISELLATVRRIEVRTNRLVNDMMVGAYLAISRAEAWISKSCVNTSPATKSATSIGM